MLEARAPEEIRKQVRRSALYGSFRKMKPGKRGVVLHLLDILCGGKEHRNMLLVWLLRDSIPEEFSANELDGGQVDALWDWLKPDKDEGVWYCSNVAAQVEAPMILTEALRAYARKFPPDLMQESPQLYLSVIELGARLIHSGDEWSVANGILGDRFSDVAIRLPRRQSKPRTGRVEAQDEIP